MIIYLTTFFFNINLSMWMMLTCYIFENSGSLLIDLVEEIREEKKAALQIINKYFPLVANERSKDGVTLKSLAVEF